MINLWKTGYLHFEIARSYRLSKNSEFPHQDDSLEF